MRTHLNEEFIKARVLREKRRPLLAAWDVAKGNIAIGVDSVSAERMAELIDWYRAILNLDESAVSEIPAEIAKYLN